MATKARDIVAEFAQLTRDCGCATSTKISDSSNRPLATIVFDKSVPVSKRAIALKAMRDALIAGLALLALFPVPASAECKCLKNVIGECMTLGHGPYPYRQFDEGISGPHCTSGYYPGWNSTPWNVTEQTARETANCKIDWWRVRRELHRESFGWPWNFQQQGLKEPGR